MPSKSALADSGYGPQMKRIRSSRIRSSPKVIRSWYSSARL